MKFKILFLCVLALASFTKVDAQKWTTQHFDGDELRKQEAYDAFNYESESGDNFIYWSNSDKDFRIINNSIAAPFDFRAISVPFTVELTNVLKHVKVGFYDENGKLKESAETEMIVSKGKGTYASVPGKKVAKKVIKFLESGGSGYVRIVAPLYGSTVPFDIKIPCRK